MLLPTPVSCTNMGTQRSLVRQPWPNICNPLHPPIIPGWTSWKIWHKPMECKHHPDGNTRLFIFFLCARSKFCARPVLYSTVMCRVEASLVRKNMITQFLHVSAWFTTVCFCRLQCLLEPTTPTLPNHGSISHVRSWMTKHTIAIARTCTLLKAVVHF